ncbi:MAG: hypothetical protein WHT65_02000 [Pseudothermotoga sp.]
MKVGLWFMVLCSVSICSFGSILYTDDFCYTPSDLHGLLLWSSAELRFSLSPTENFSVFVENNGAGFSARILKFSRLEVVTRIDSDSFGFYLQDRKPFLAFNHFTIGFDFSKQKSLLFSTLIESYGILPDEFVNLGASLRIYESGERILKLLAHLRLWRAGMIASMNYGGDAFCSVSFYFSF